MTLLAALVSEVYSDCGEALVLDPLSWETHHLTPLSWLVYEALLQRPRQRDELVALAAQSLGEPTSAAGPRVDHVLLEFRRLGLVTEEEAQRL